MDFSKMLYTFANKDITNNRLMVLTHSLNGFHSPSTEYILPIRAFECWLKLGQDNFSHIGLLHILSYPLFNAY